MTFGFLCVKKKLTQRAQSATQSTQSKFLNMETPVWLIEEKIKIKLDARPILASGEHPLEQVLRDIGNLSSGDIYMIITPFIPAPMIEKISAMGFDNFVKQESFSEVHTYFHKIWNVVDTDIEYRILNNELWILILTS